MAGLTDLGAVDPGSLNKKQERLLGRYAIRTELGDDTRAARLAQRLQGTGITDPAGTLAGAGDPQALMDDALMRMAQQGALGGKRAKSLNARLIRQDQLGEIDTWGNAARTEGLDQIGSQYGNYASQLQSVIGGMDTSSPAIASILAGLAEGRGTDTSQFLTNIEQQQSQARMGVNEGIGLGIIGQTLDETGALVEALNQLREQEMALNRATAGRNLSNPFSAGASLFGANRNSAAGFGGGMMDNFAMVLAALNAGGAFKPSGQKAA